MTQKELESVAKFFKFPLGKLSFTEDNVIAMEVSKQKKIVGFSSILNDMHNSMNKNEDPTQHYLTKQFFDFSNLFLRNTNKKDKCKLMKKFHWIFIIFMNFNISVAACYELNSYLERRSYIIGQQISIADLVVFFAIEKVMKQLSPLEKEQLLNLSRFYNHIQQFDGIASDSSVIFSTIHL